MKLKTKWIEGVNAFNNDKEVIEQLKENNDFTMRVMLSLNNLELVILKHINDVDTIVYGSKEAYDIDGSKGEGKVMNIEYSPYDLQGDDWYDMLISHM